MADYRHRTWPRRPRFGRRLLALAATLALLALGMMQFAPDAFAQESTALKQGAASLEAGKYEVAVRQLTAAVNAENASAADAAKALYLRGMANRKLGQQARAISDLGAAVWLGLAGADRTKALVNRGLAYRAAGLTQQAEAEIALARKTGSSSEVEKLIAEDGGPAPAAGAVTAFSTEVRREGEAETETVSPFAAPAPAPSAPPPSTAEAPAAAPASKPTESSSWSTSVDDGSAPAPSGGNRLTRWFSSVTGPSDAPQPPPPPSTETASQQSAPTTGWGAQTDAAPQARTRTADATPAATATSGASGWSTQVAEATPSAASSGGAYRLQLTASRSEAEAQQLWKKVSSANPQLAATQPTIEKTDIGGLGTFYRLQVGPFPDKAESLKLCNALKRSGVDCFLVQ
jgi:tetratricopeptide (TPR) repeat protein